MFKEERKEIVRINIERNKEAVQTGASIIAADLSILQYNADGWSKKMNRRKWC
jgi:hypothetical protein